MKKGDIAEVHEEGWGTGAVQDYMVVDLDNILAIDPNQLMESEYIVGTTGNDNVLRRQRKYKLDLDAKCSPAELASLALGGQPGTDYLERFMLSDIVRKGDCDGGCGMFRTTAVRM
jgi:hypothetical protein